MVFVIRAGSLNQGWAGYPFRPDIRYCRIFSLTLLKLFVCIAENLLYQTKLKLSGLILMILQTPPNLPLCFINYSFCCHLRICKCKNLVWTCAHPFENDFEPNYFFAACNLVFNMEESYSIIICELGDNRLSKAL